MDLSEELGGLSVALRGVVGPGHVVQAPRRAPVPRREGTEIPQGGREVVAVETLVGSPGLPEETHECSCSGRRGSAHNRTHSSLELFRSN